MQKARSGLGSLESFPKSLAGLYPVQPFLSTGERGAKEELYSALQPVEWGNVLCTSKPVGFLFLTCLGGNSLGCMLMCHKSLCSLCLGLRAAAPSYYRPDPSCLGCLRCVEAGRKRDARLGLQRAGALGRKGGDVRFCSTSLPPFSLPWCIFFFK